MEFLDEHTGLLYINYQTKYANATNSNMNSSTNENPHFVMVPLMAQGHMIPMVDMAHLLSTHGAIVTVVTTPLNAARLATVIDRIAESKLPIKFLSLEFPCTEVGLPDGCENIDSVPSNELLKNFVAACAMLKDPLVSYLKKQRHAPNCIISDAAHIWTDKVAREFGITRITFNGFGSFALLCRHIFRHDRTLDEIEDEHEVFVMPGLPHRIEMTKARSPSNFTAPGMDEFRKELAETELAADSVVVNSFEDLEAPYVECLQKARGMKVWTIGPTSLYNQNNADMASRGNKASIDGEQCLSWLDSMKPNSVIYVSFGSLARTSLSQLVEIGLGLEASNCPFIWVVKAGNKSSEVEEWLADGFEGRTSKRGLIIRGWAPQLLILSHPAIGGFMTHCGWNSTLESVSAGVPMITWPQFAEQFLNEKLVADVLRIGISIGVQAPIRWGTVQTEAAVTRGRVKKTVCRLMHEEEEGRVMRERAAELGKKAKRAMAKGGSSHENMKLLVQQIRNKMKISKNG